MFLNQYKSKAVWRRFTGKRFKRSIRGAIKLQKRRCFLENKAARERAFLAKHIPCVKAPSKLSLSRAPIDDKTNKTPHTLFVEFKEQLEMCAKRAVEEKVNQLRISFEDTDILYAEACVILIATLDTIRSQYPLLKFSVVRPRKMISPANVTKFKPSFVDDVFCHVGLYKLLGFDYKTSSTGENVKSWHYVFSDEVDGSVTDPIFNELEKMGLQNTSVLYTGVIEGISNAVEHAYNKEICTGRELGIHRWWMLMAVRKNQLLIFVCDLGHGIPKTLRVANDHSLLINLFEKFKAAIDKSTDCMDIKVALHLRETRTKVSHRGKGGEDIKAFVSKIPNSQMMIYSNKGSYRYRNSGAGSVKKGYDQSEILYDNELSINGTLISWSIPLHKEV